MGQSLAITDQTGHLIQYTVFHSLNIHGTALKTCKMYYLALKTFDGDNLSESDGMTQNNVENEPYFQATREMVSTGPSNRCKLCRG